MRTAYLNCFSGISGDMCLGTLLDAGISSKELTEALRAIPVENYAVTSEKVQRAGIAATKVDVRIENHVHRHETRWRDIEDLINRSALPSHIKDSGLAVFRELFSAEAIVHGSSFDEVHLHELGGIDCIVDIFGTVIGFDMLGINEIFVSPINLGSGTVKTSHGILPVPAPATAELLKAYPVYSTDSGFELTTPTGAAILRGLNAKPGPIPVMIMDITGYGAGGREIESLPNVLRLVAGNPNISGNSDRITVLETNIDDMNPQLYENIFDKLFGAGALDVFLENIIMKKGRPAHKLTVLADKNIKKITEIIFRETTTIGLRTYTADRIILEREIKKMQTRFGSVKVKFARLDAGTTRISAEYEDIKTISEDTGLSMKNVFEAVNIDIQNNKPATK
ncbi:MAG: nickel pincer cofactor biosynthesis protein LarC [Dissulfurispiraceae bacterium]|jgi:uncharacterized protein (TIGR00299 family) protein|nr:nickel pincer cofactor biosynthesis protein LarC [Dissulfurispiraceae bacterium]